ncbi:DUF3857 domain-containing protein [Rubrivirga sp. IMCC45206]|uniref:DUF3857 domain-containing protein n=1 Tax=Rubrivirga sp. IMCC45206 TaxID=3391614 RepID=UPI00398F9770
MIRRLAVFAVLLAPLAAVAQDPPIRWGRLNDADKALETVADPDAHAVVLADVGFAELDLRMGQSLTYKIRRHTRVKILDEAGYAQGEFAMRYNGDDQIRRVRGQTFVPDGQGDYRRVELSGRDILDEVVAPGTREVRFSMPALQPGAIFEIEYTYETDQITILPGWTFQSDEPTLVSEYRLILPVYFEYATVSQGRRFQAFPREQIRRADYDAAEFRWQATDVPALRDEPYTTTEADFAEYVGFQLRAVHRPDGFTDTVLSTWPEFAETLRDADAFGRRQRGTRRARELARATVAGLVDDEAKARALYDLVRTEFVWDGTHRTFADRDLDAVAQARSGTSGELAHLLVAMLAEAGIPAHPVLLSSRANGRPVTAYPVAEQFDRILVAPVVPGAGLTLLDPTSPHRPYGEVDVQALNGEVWLADYARPRWVPLRAPRDTETTTLVRGRLAPDGTLAGTLQLRLAGYDAFDARVAIAQEAAASGTADALSDAADADESVAFADVVVTGIDSVDASLDLTASLTTAAAEVVGDEMYLTPFVVMQLEENPFQRETRTFPVDFAYPFKRTYVADIAIPDGWEAVDLPETVSLAIPSRKVRYQRFVSAAPGGVSVRTVLMVTESQVEADEYPALRELYDEIVATEAEALVLVRTGEPGPPPPAPPVDTPEPDAGDDAGGDQ